MRQAQQSEAPEAPAPRSVLVVGTGLVGTSVALALRRGAPLLDVLLHDDDPATAQAAAALGAGDPWRGQQADLAVVAVPPRAVPQALAQWSSLASTLMSVSSVMTQPEVKSPTGGARFVRTHPMAGSHGHGPEAASPDLFRGRTWAVEPADVDQGSLHDVLWLVRACGARPLLVTPADHDRAVALVSHLPQVVASALAAELADAEPAALALAGPGVRDTTRIAGSPVALWQDILALNAATVAPLVRSVGRRLVAVADGLGDPDVVEALLAAGQAGVGRLPGRHTAADAPGDELAVEVEDAPGALAAIMSTAARAGVNVEDIALDHAPAAPGGRLHLVVAAGSGERLAALLRESGRGVTLTRQVAPAGPREPSGRGRDDGAWSSPPKMGS